MNFLNVKEYGVKKTWDNQWETFAHTPDGKYLMPITWAREVYKTKKEAKRQIEKLAKKWNWKLKPTPRERLTEFQADNKIQVSARKSTNNNPESKTNGEKQ